MFMHALFKNRAEAGRMLADRLKGNTAHDAVVLALPRGGVPVGAEIARALGLELDVMPVRKLGVPGQPELAMGAIAPGGAQFVDRQIMHSAHVSQAAFEKVLAEEQAELARRETRYRDHRPPASVEGRTVILVDDGMATGATMRAALSALRQRNPAHVIVALPVAPPGAESDLTDLADEFVCIAQPALFFSVGQHYDEFDQTSDEEVRRLLGNANERMADS